LRQNPYSRGMRFVLWMLLLCLCGTSAILSQVVPSAVKKAAGIDGTQPAASATTNTQAETPKTPPPEPVDELGRISPHGCVLGFLRAAQAKDYHTAAQYLDGERSEKEGEELAAQLATLLDLGLSTSIDDLSRSPKGTTEGKLRLSRERVGVVKTSQGDLEVLLDLVNRPNEPPIWLFSQETLNKVPGAYASVQQKDYSQYFPSWMNRVSFLSIPLWRWTLVLFNLLLIFVAAAVLTRFLLWLLRVVFRKRLTSNVEASVLRLKRPLFGLMLAFLLYIAKGYAITALARHYWGIITALAAWFSGAWLLVRLADIFVAYERNRLLLQMRVERVTFIGLLGRFFKILIGITLIIALLRGAGINVSAVVAGLGIGGIALALAAQSTLADLFGGLSVVMRGAVRVGDFCQIDGILGTVEDIGISSLSLRTLDRTLVSIPNSKVAQVKLENYAMRDQFWLHQVFTLRFDTPHKVVKAVLDRFVEVLGANPEIERRSARARLIGMNPSGPQIGMTPSGPQIEVFAYFRRPGADWAVFLGEQEKIILKMMGIVEAEGTSLAVPVSIVQMKTGKKDDGSVDSATGSV
jgi:MscS family membrane protein